MSLGSERCIHLQFYFILSFQSDVLREILVLEGFQSHAPGTWKVNTFLSGLALAPIVPRDGDLRDLKVFQVHWLLELWFVVSDHVLFFESYLHVYVVSKLLRMFDFKNVLKIK